MNNNKLICHGCEKHGKLYLHVTQDNFIYALCIKCVKVQIEIEYYNSRDGI